MTDEEEGSPARHDQVSAEREAAAGTRSIDGFRALGFFTTDHAAVESGKVYSAGAYWSVLRFPAFPATLQTASIVAVIQVPFHANQADHKFTISLQDTDGRNLPQLRVEGTFRSAPTLEAAHGEPGVFPVAIPVYALQFERPGDYSFTMSIDDKNIARYPFRVVQIAVMAAGSPQA